ncbi:mucoidy inhibitor MuiA family protein [Mesonia aquimarina]|uniref:mucoidy inhibitor MuiA family protein n=1 Tax=Mesonia aquimarina TaxID=1504967 RepID=UPI000EF60C4A|nr:mucoidy inhibitor MuiA family protein [Mesonia aquimarina]
MNIKFFLFLFLPSLLFASEINPKLTPKKVTVFLSGAQVTSEASFNLPAGSSKVVFSDLSPTINQNSIQVSGVGEVTISAVNYRITYLGKDESSPQMIALKEQLITKNRALTLLRNKIAGLEEEESVLITNKKINTDNESASLEKLKQYAVYYRNRISEIKTEIYDTKQQLNELQAETTKIQQEINQLKSEQSGRRGEIELLLDAPRSQNVVLSITYNVSNAGWFPTYDIKADNTEEPLHFSYKANVFQETGVNWNEVELKLSTGDPSIPSEKPSVNPHYLNFINSRNSNQNYYQTNQPYNPSVKKVYGTITDSGGLPLPGVNIAEEGTSNGTQSDFDGNYNLSVTRGKKLVYSFVGFQTARIPIYANQMNLQMQASNNTLDEVVITSYSGKVSGVRVEGDQAEPEVMQTPKVVREENIMTTEFTIDKPYSIPSLAENTVVTIKSFTIPAEYEYYSAPLLKTSVYLTATLKNWENLDLLPGDANIYFQNSFVGNTFLQTKEIDKDLKISLGSDPSIVVERKQVNNKKDKSFFGGTRILNRNYEITLKNNKNTAVEVHLEDRIPISQNDEIKVEEREYGKASYNEKTGILSWSVNLSAKESQSKNFSYEVKYPKEKSINLN